MVLILSIITQTRDIQTALETFRQHGGVMRTSQALMRGIHPAALYRLVEDGQLMRLARGLYRLTSVIHSTSAAEGCHPGRPQLDERRGQFRESLDLLPSLLRML